MASKRAKPLPPQANDTLIRLRKLYGQQPQIQYDKYGRRKALPSEIASLLKHGRPSSGTP